LGNSDAEMYAGVSALFTDVYRATTAATAPVVKNATSVSLAAAESVHPTLSVTCASVNVGDTVGDIVGLTVGELVVGDVVGGAVGSAVGVAVGDADGMAVGEAVGNDVGAAVGAVVGAAVGLKLRNECDAPVHT
jgi:hypothetical protein